jgi:hypothetical protein
MDGVRCDLIPVVAGRSVRRGVLREAVLRRAMRRCPTRRRRVLSM